MRGAVTIMFMCSRYINYWQGISNVKGETNLRSNFPERNLPKVS